MKEIEDEIHEFKSLKMFKLQTNNFDLAMIEEEKQSVDDESAQESASN